MQHITVPIKPPPFPDWQSLPSHPPNQPLQEPNRLVSLLITRFAQLPKQESGAGICAMLGDVVRGFGLDGCGLISVGPDRTEARPLHYCQGNGELGAPADFPLGESVPWSHANLMQGKIVCFAAPSELPPEAAQDRCRYQAAGIQSYLAIPIYVDSSVQFCLAAHRLRSAGPWSRANISLLRLIGEILVMSLSQQHREAEPRLQLEELIRGACGRLMNATEQTVHGEITAALEQVREAVALDRFGLLTLSGEKREMMVTHSSYAEGIAPVPEKVNISALFPWAKERLLEGETIHITDPLSLPPEAAVDARSWQVLGVRENLSIPIEIAGSVQYLLAGSLVRATGSIDPSLIPTLRLLGQIFALALVRCQGEAALSEARAELRALKEKLQADAELLQAEAVCSQRHEEIVGQSAALAKTLALTEQVAPTDSTVLIFGETGTGKELVAQSIHKLGARRNRQMVKVNCASLPAALVESELFGREKGAYTGALTRQAGRFELADGGTIFLDEIAEMSLELQAKLLRVLQEGQFERLGSCKTIHVDVRVIAATNRNLSEEVKKGNFREDLYYRLNVFQIVVPPLRERIEDIPLLVWSFINEFGEKMGKKINKISKQDMSALQSYHWPGNVRELRNVLEHAVIVSNGEKLQVRLPENCPQETPMIRTLEEYEIVHIKDALRLTGWRIKGDGGAANLLGLNPSTLYSRMQKLGISSRPGKDEISP